MGDLRRALAQRDEPAVGEHVEHAPGVVVAVGVELVERDAPAEAAPSLLAGEAQQDAPRHGLLRRVEALVGVLGEPRDRAAHAAGALIGGEAQRAPSRRCHSSSSAVDSSGSAPGSRLGVGQQAVDERGLDVQARRAAGARSRGAARRAASGRRGRGWPPSRPTSSGMRAAAVEVGAHREHDGAGARRARAVASMNAARSASSRQSVNTSSNWSTAISGAPGAAASASRSSVAGGCSPGAEQHLRPVLRCPAGTPLRARPAARPEGGRLAAARRAHHREQRRAREPRDHLGTRRSRPKKNSASATSNGARPLNGQTTSARTRSALGALAHRLQLDDAARELLLGRRRPPRSPAVRSAAGASAAAPPRRAPTRRRGDAPARGIPPLRAASSASGISAPAGA